ncbi:unnamed protein product, partial [Owenia fusiformis]
PCTGSNQSSDYIKSLISMRAVFEILVVDLLMKHTEYVVPMMGYCIEGGYTLEQIINNEVSLIDISATVVVELAKPYDNPNTYLDTDHKLKWHGEHVRILNEFQIISNQSGILTAKMPLHNLVNEHYSTSSSFRSVINKAVSWQLRHLYILANLTVIAENIPEGPILLNDLTSGNWAHTESFKPQIIDVEAFLFKDPVCADTQSTSIRFKERQKLIRVIGSKTTDQCLAVGLKCDNITRVCDGFYSNVNLYNVVLPYLDAVLELLDIVTPGGDVKGDASHGVYRKIWSALSSLKLQIQDFKISPNQTYAILGDIGPE